MSQASQNSSGLRVLRISFFFFYLVLLKVWRNNTHQVPISAQDVQEFIFIIVFWSDRQSLLKNNRLEQNISHLLNMIIVRL